ncbi:hypothetical protein [Kitasatospora griseola]|uniref:hypothetical protein n=1 Tax=Kitasatospora griseola TaxID=2064 RepID=UPI0016717B5D|nr:hypothetical protein [Kitasatospora griseola]
MPGFYAEASAGRGTGSFRTGPLERCGAPDRIVPVWHAPTCDGLRDKCERRCNSTILSPDFLTEYDTCMDACGDAFTACLEAQQS